jgi:hypothetical protein
MSRCERLDLTEEAQREKVRQREKVQLGTGERQDNRATLEMAYLKGGSVVFDNKVNRFRREDET